jgi:hypothetical protein
MVEILADLGKPIEIAKTLVLDSVECMGRIRDGRPLWEALRELGAYRTIYTGTATDSIDLPSWVDRSKTRSRQSFLVGYESNFNRYNGDSRNLITLLQRDPDTTATLRRMGPGDLHRAKYLEKWAYGPEVYAAFIKVDVRKSPSYVIDSETNIWGYLVTSLHKDAKDGESLVLEFDDMFVAPCRRAVASLAYAFEDLDRWAREAGISRMKGNFNEHSEPFVARMERAGWTVEREKDPTHAVVYNKVVAERGGRAEWLAPDSVAVDLMDRGNWEIVQDPPKLSEKEQQNGY